MESALKELAGTLAKAGAPALGTIIGGAIGGPLGALVPIVLTSLAEALGTDPTPEAVDRAIKADPAAAVEKIQPVETQATSELELLLKDKADARQQTLKLVESGSLMAWGAGVVSVIVLCGFAVLSYLAIYAPAQQREVLLFLLGNWSGLATGVVAYWVGSSSSSKQKDETLSRLIISAAPQSIPAQKAGKK